MTPAQAAKLRQLTGARTDDEMMDILQHQIGRLIADTAVHAEDVADSDAERAIKILTDTLF